MLAVFKPYTDPRGVYHPNGKDPYLDFASKMYGLPYEVLFMDKEGENGEGRQVEAKRKRQVAKPGVLGAIYRLSGGQWGHNKYGDRIKTGMWGYAENMGVEMTQEQAHEIVRMFRQAYVEIGGVPDMSIGFPGGIWYRLEDAVSQVMHPDHPQTVRQIGPNGCVTIDRINFEGRNSMMRMHLPSGRYLHYLDARLEDCKMPWTRKNEETGAEEDVYRESLVYAGTNQDTKQWDIWVQTHGGKLFENLVQGIARDVLATKLLEFEANDLPVHLHVHDEGGCLVPDTPISPTVSDMIAIMSTPIPWAPGLLLGADGFEDFFYHK